MATNVLTAIRHCASLHGNVKFTALEIAHLMNRSGYGRVAYQYMAHKTGYCRRTMITHMDKLVRLGIFAKTVYRLKFGNAINLYRCLLALPRLACPSSTVSKGANSAQTLPTPKAEEKELSLQEEIRLLRKGLVFLTDTESEIYKSCQERITTLEALMHGGRE
jgi:hypothetical protein